MVSQKPLRRKQFFALFPINSVSFAILFLSEADLDRLPPSSEDGQNFPEFFLMQFLFIEKSKNPVCLSVYLSQNSVHSVQVMSRGGFIL